MALNKLFYLLVAFTLFLSGCSINSQAPSFLLFDSYFPTWLVGAVIAVPVTILIRWIFIKISVDDYLPLRFLMYLGIWLVLTMVFSYVYSPR